MGVHTCMYDIQSFKDNNLIMCTCISKGIANKPAILYTNHFADANHID